MDYNTIMALFKPRPGTVTVIRGDMIEVVDLLWCEQCKLHHIDKDHAVKHQEPVEPDVVRKETKIAGLLTYPTI